MRAMQAVLALAITISMTAQEARQMPEIVIPPLPVEVEAPPPVDPIPERELPLFTGRDVSTNSLVDGTAGEVILNGTAAPWPSTVAGVVLRTVNPGYPDIVARLGGSLGYFRILDQNNVQLFLVKADGSVGIGTTPAQTLHLSRNQDAATAILVNNNNAGTTSAPALRSLRFSAGATTMAQITSVGSASTGVAGGANALQLWNHMSAPTVFGTADAERMRILANGNITVGSTADYGRLGVYDNRDAGYAFRSIKETVIEGNAVQFEHAAIASTVETVNTAVQNDGAAVGTYTSAYRQGSGRSWRVIGLQSAAGIVQGHDGSVSQAIGFLIGIGKGSGVIDAGYGVLIEDIDATAGFGVYQSGANDSNFFAGKIGVGTTAPTHSLHVVGSGRVTGDFTVEGNIAARFQDVAEWVPATEDLAPGTVVVLDPNVSNQVTASTRAYDTTVAGVVSVQPGIILGEGGASKEQIATTGRVKVRVDATVAPIRIGDLLVSSSRTGMAMKSEAVEIGGIAMHRPGTLIGKALEPLEGGVGEILVLLSLQ
jgi:hypothetical protein